MKNNFKLVMSALLIGLMTLSISCTEEFNEEDALKAQQNMSLTVYVYDGSSAEQAPIEGATVTISQGGESIEAISDASGVAQFPELAIGEYVYKVVATDFVTVTDTYGVSTSNFRVHDFTQSISMVSTSEDNLATIKGTLLIDTDVTNLTKEVAAGVEVYVDVQLNSGTKRFTAITDENGYYEIQVPTNGVNNGTDVNIRFENLELDQTIAVNKFSDESGSFPTILPRIETVKTAFASNTNSTSNNYFSSNNVRSLYAVADPAPAGGADAVISNVYTNSIGEVTGIGFSNGGNYTGDEDGVVNISIVSLDGGSDASIEVTLGDQTNLSNAYSEYGTATRVFTAGSGYPTNNNNYTQNKISYRNPSFTDYVYVSPGTVRYANGDYGTGTQRPRGVQ